MMMMLTNSGDGANAVVPHNEEERERGRSEEGERNSSANRWPKHETMALLKIRSDMEVTFRDSCLKGPLWDEVSRKLGQLGYHRSSKKCKEKFENVFKYHRRTKDGRTSKPDGKTYRFFDQLEAFQSNPSQAPIKPQAQTMAEDMKPQDPTIATSTTSESANPTNNLPVVQEGCNVHLTTNNISVTQGDVTKPPPPPPIPSHPIVTSNPSNFGFPSSHLNTSVLNSTSSSTSSEPDRRQNRKRKWEDFFARLMKEIIEKQEDLQNKFLDTLEKRERDRMVREEAWRAQEMAKMNRDHEFLVKERSIAAAKDAAVIQFLQKMTQQQISPTPNISTKPQKQIHVQIQELTPPPLPPPPPPPGQPVQQRGPPLPQQAVLAIQNFDNEGDNSNIAPSPSRWPKTEIQALINLRTTMDMKYQENVPKGPLWEEISVAMRKLGYNRNAKRCKEKWENINKYYKKVKESSKKRPEDAKTCPYFHQLEAIYKEKAMGDGSFNQGFFGPKSENPVGAIMAQPQRQWPENNDPNNGDDSGEDDDDDEDEVEVDAYEGVTNIPVE